MFTVQFPALAHLVLHCYSQAKYRSHYGDDCLPLTASGHPAGPYRKEKSR